MTSVEGGSARREIAGLLLVLAGFGIAGGRVVGVGAAFEHDEAVYAVQARAWTEGAPDTGVRLHRAPGLPGVGTLVLWAGRSETAFRIVGLLLGTVAVVALWGLGRAAGGPGVGVLAAGVFVGSPHVVERSAQFLTDLPAAGLLLAAAWVMWRELELRADGPGWRLVGAAPLVAGAFYLRYGSALPVALVVVTAAALWWRRIARRPRPAVATCAVLAGLLAPHVVYAMRAFGTPWGAISFTTRVASQASFGEGLREYLTWFPFFLAGPVAAVVMAIGLGAGSRAARERRADRDARAARGWRTGHSADGSEERIPGRDARAAVFLLAPAIGQIVLLGLAVHAEPRFLFFPVALLLIAGSGVIARVAREQESSEGRSHRALRIGVGVTVLLAFVAGAQVALHRTERARDQRAPVAEAARAMRALATGPCSALSIEVPVVTWYSGCATYSFGEPPRPGREALLRGRRRFLVMLDGPRFPLSEELRRYYLRFAGGAPPIVHVEGEGMRAGDVAVYRVR